jgi:hypothetical protein
MLWKRNFTKSQLPFEGVWNGLVRMVRSMGTLLLAFSVVLHLMLLLLIDPQLYIPTM